MKKPFFMIAGTNSGCGKTTVTLGIIHSLVQKKLKVAAFKAGPDYIDPSYHKALTGIPSCNLDSWMMSKDTINYLAADSLQNADIGIIEGVMGLYDGIAGDDYPEGSSAHLAEILQAPVILIVNAKGLAQSIIPLVNGYITHSKNIKFLGVILNNIGSSNHYKILNELIEDKCGLPCFGFIKKLSFKLPERHLGLIPFQELNDGHLKFNEITNNIDIELLLKEAKNNTVTLKISEKTDKSRYNLTIAVARDKVFSFYYEDNLNVLREHGVQIQFFSPLKDKSLPAGINGIYFGGGFPEIFAKELLSNETMINNVREIFMNEIPVYAECGGLIYLFDTLIDHDNNRYKMVGLIKGTIKMKKKKQALGYYEARLKDADLPPLRGHQFHYSQVIGMDDPEVLPLYNIKKPAEVEWKAEGFRKRSLITSYLHLHFRDNPEFVKYFLDKCNVKVDKKTV